MVVAAGIEADTPEGAKSDRGVEANSPAAAQQKLKSRLTQVIEKNIGADRF